MTPPGKTLVMALASVVGSAIVPGAVAVPSGATKIPASSAAVFTVNTASRLTSQAKRIAAILPGKTTRGNSQPVYFPNIAHTLHGTDFGGNCGGPGRSART